MKDFIRRFLSFTPGTELYEGSLFEQQAKRTKHVVSERAVLQFFLATGGTIDEAKLTILSGLARGTIKPSPKHRAVSENTERAFLMACGETDKQINEHLAKRRAYNRTRSDILALRGLGPSQSNPSPT